MFTRVEQIIDTGLPLPTLSVYTWATKRSCYGVERMIDARLPLPTPEHLVSIFYSPDRVLLLSSTQEAPGDGFGQQHNFHCQFTKIAIFKNLEIEKSPFPNSITVCSFPGSLTALQDWAITTTKKKETAAPDGRGCNNNHRDLILQRHQKEKCFQNKMYCQQTAERFWPLCRTIKSCVNANISHSHSASQGCQMPNVTLIVMRMKFGECKLDLH